jgi:hypothetical protein
MTSPSQSKKLTLQELRRTRRDMLSAEWLLAVKKQPKSVRRKAAFQLLNVEQAILELGNAQLAEIRDKLIANEKDLRLGRENLKIARKELTQVTNVLSKIEKLLEVVGKVVKFVVTA